jgi:hypothetical protein
VIALLNVIFDKLVRSLPVTETLMKHKEFVANAVSPSVVRSGVLGFEIS